MYKIESIHDWNSPFCVCDLATYITLRGHMLDFGQSMQQKGT